MHYMTVVSLEKSDEPFCYNFCVVVYVAEFDRMMIVKT